MEAVGQQLEVWLAGLGGVATMALLVVLGLVFTAWSLFSRSRLADDPETKMANDRLVDSRRGWVQGASQILMRLHDNAYLPEEMIGDMLRQSWGIDDLQQLDAQVSRLVAQERDAWGLLRALLLLRSAVAVGWLSNEASFARCYLVGEELQRRYDSWDEMAEDLLRRRRAWRGIATDGSADDDDMKELREVVDYLRSTLWRETAWMHSLQSKH